MTSDIIQYIMMKSNGSTATGNKKSMKSNPDSPVVEQEMLDLQRQVRTQSGNLFKQMADKMWQRHKTCGTQSKVINPIKALVSKNKKRFEWNGYDLDLAYITDNIIAMGFPSEKLESIYRNSMQDVKRFLKQRHHDRFRVYNLCSQRKYPNDQFEGNVVEMPFEDHMPPPFQLIYDFCQDAESWLRKDDENVVAVHCKAGKGRTGVMIACLLMWMKEVECGWDALEYYAVMRTFNYKGVTIPSQIRYVLYFELAMKRSLTKQIYLKNIPKISIKKIWVGPVPKVDLFGGCTPWVLVLNNGNEFKSKYTHELNTYKSQESFELPIDHKFKIAGDFKVTFFTKGAVLNKSQKFMHVWLNTYFLQGTQIRLRSSEIDGVKQGDNRFSDKLQILIQFSRM